MARIDVLTDRPIGVVDRRIFGGFTEHRGRCIYGGLFDDGSRLAAPSPTASGTGASVTRCTGTGGSGRAPLRSMWPRLAGGLGHSSDSTPVSACLHDAKVTGVMTARQVTGHSPDAVNTLARPDAVSVRNSKREVEGEHVDVTFAPHSFTLL